MNDTITTTVNGTDHANAMGYAVVFYAGVGCPGGTSIALINHETTTPFDLDNLDGVVTDGIWSWDGEGQPTDGRGNSVLKIQVYNDEDEYVRQYVEYREG